VPSGEQIVWISAEVEDGSATEDLWLWLSECPNLIDPRDWTSDLHTSGGPGKVILATSPRDTLITVDNNLRSSQFRSASRRETAPACCGLSTRAPASR